MRKQQTSEVQLSLFEDYTLATVKNTVKEKEPTVLDFVRARFEYGPDMNQEEYRRWIKILINHSLRSMDPTE